MVSSTGAPQPAPQNVAQTASQPGSQTSGQGGAQPSAVQLVRLRRWDVIADYFSLT